MWLHLGLRIDLWVVYLKKGGSCWCVGRGLKIVTQIMVYGIVGGVEEKFKISCFKEGDVALVGFVIIMKLWSLLIYNNNNNSGP